MPEFTKEFRYDKINGSDFSEREAYESATIFAEKVNGVVSYKDGHITISANGKEKYYTDPSCWPAYVVTYNAEEEIPE